MTQTSSYSITNTCDKGGGGGRLQVLEAYSTKLDSRQQQELSKRGHGPELGDRLSSVASTVERMGLRYLSMGL